MFQIIVTVVFGFLWWWVYTHVGAGLAYLMILGSVLAVCVCCCRDAGGEWQPWAFNYQGWLACIRRCWRQTLLLMIGLFLLGILVAWFMSGMFPPAAELANILLAAVGAPLLVRLICCAYET